jgi:hypothetical protein
MIAASGAAFSHCSPTGVHSSSPALPYQVGMSRDDEREHGGTALFLAQKWLTWV